MELLTLDGLALLSDGPTLTLSVRAGDAVAIMGPTRSGKTALLRACTGREKPARGRATATGGVAFGGEGLGARRLRVASVAKATSHPKANDALVALGLTGVLNDPVADLASGTRAAVETLRVALSGEPLLALDGTLDRLDPWAFAAGWNLLETACQRGAALLVTSNRPEIAARCDTVVVLRERQVRFAGTAEALRRLGPPHELTVTTERQIGVRALVSPFEVTIEQTPEGLRMEAREGQELAARLLRDGYGDVRYIVSRPPTLDEGLQSL